MEQQILRMETELQSEYGDEDWSTTFRAGPDSIGILAECIVITSRPKVIGIELKGPGLLYATLSANVIHCADVGVDAFETTARNMKLLAQLTNELSQPNGTIETMLKFCEPGQSKARDRRLSTYITKGEEIVTHCTDLIAEASKSFDSWRALTKALYRALQDALGQKRRQEQDVKSEIENSKVTKELKEDQTRKEEAKMWETKRLMQKTRKKKEQYEDYAAAAATGSGVAESIAAAVASTSAAAIAGVGLVVGGAAAYIHYRALKAELISMKEAEERRNHEIRELEAAKATLEKTLAQLSAESKSIEEVAQIVTTSFKKVTELQQLVRNFMSFLLNINIIISYTAKRSQFVYEAVKEKEDLIDPLIKRDLLEHAFDMKTRFIFASKASNIYNAVSSQYILPTLNMLPQLSRLDTDDEIKSKLQELLELRCAVCSETGTLTKKMHEELKESLAEVTRDSARVFEDITSVDSDVTEQNS